MIRRILLILFLFFSFENSYCQVIMSLILGDNLNSGKVEFGLDGGMNISSLTNVSGSKSVNNFNLGFYFDIKMKDPWMFHTGVIVKSRMGAEDIPVYSLGDINLDSSFIGGHVHRKLDYFNVPLMIKYNFKNKFYIETGTMLGLLYGATDQFINNVNDHELTYKVKNRDAYNRIDAGWMSGIGYRLVKGNGVNLSIRYYIGLVDITKNTASSVKNNSLYFAVGIPIGVKKARERAAEKEKLEKQNNKQ